MERFYYKDRKGSLFNLKSPDFIKYSEVDEKVYQTDENGEPIIDENGEPIYVISKKRVADGLLDGYKQITKEEYEKLTKQKGYVPTAEEKSAQDKARKIAEYKKYLENTDYIVLKMGEYLADGNTEAVTSIKTEYAEQLAKRKEARDKINELEK